MSALKRFLLAVDSFAESFALLSIVSMVIIVTIQVFTRKLFNFVFFWSEEVTLLLLAWFSYMGIAIGFREHLHMEMDIMSSAPPKVLKVLDKFVQFSTLIFGLYLIVYGWEFTVLMGESTLPATKMPNSVLYIVMPITGLMTSCYALLQLFGIETKRHKDVEAEEEFKADA